MRWVCVAALALLIGAAAYGAYIENTVSMTYLDPYTGEEVTVWSNTERTEILEPHTVDVTATAELIP